MVLLFFEISHHEKDEALFELLQNYFGVSRIYYKGPKSIIFMIRSIEELRLIISHFNNYPLITQKGGNF